ncbi:MAG: hypothetical protein K2M13_09140 [Muribaculaceae bacterium]|nr:hypothetical protein [Muribaculaceae bacterium]
MRIVFAICEGPHDTSFLAKLLKSKGYTSYTNPLSQFPEPPKNWFVKQAKDLRVEEIGLNNLYSNITSVLPRQALVNEELHQLILLYALGGDKQKERREKLLTTLKDWGTVPTDDKAFSITEEFTESGNNFGCLLFFDADNLGVETRIQEGIDEMKTYFPIKGEIRDNGDIEEINPTMKVGIYIFADAESKKGNLENILLPLMKHGNEKIFEDADHFIESHYNEDRLKPLVFKKENNGEIYEKRKGTPQFDHFKSIIGVVGQLQISGSSNTVCIEKSDYLNLDKIHNNHMCQDILKMFAKL